MHLRQMQLQLCQESHLHVVWSHVIPGLCGLSKQGQLNKQRKELLRPHQWAELKSKAVRTSVPWCLYLKWKEEGQTLISQTIRRGAEHVFVVVMTTTSRYLFSFLFFSFYQQWLSVSGGSHCPDHHFFSHYLLFFLKLSGKSIKSGTNMQLLLITGLWM